MLATYCGAIETGFGELDDAPDLCPKTYELDEEKQISQMNNYLIKNHQKFNKSQAKVLEQIIEMPKDDILLIQGPVSYFNLFFNLFFVLAWYGKNSHNYWNYLNADEYKNRQWKTEDYGLCSVKCSY